jgi:cytidine deaminase
MLSEQDNALIEAARAAIRKRYRNDWQEVGAAMRTRSGQMLTGVNLDAYLGRMAVCAEAVALGRAIMEGGVAPGGPFLRTAVAVRHPKPEEAGEIAIVSPCGACREMITDYARDALVIVPGTDGAPVKLPIATLLPLPYRR